jgi:hypothetical protein
MFQESLHNDFNYQFKRSLLAYLRVLAFQLTHHPNPTGAVSRNKRSTSEDSITNPHYLRTCNRSNSLNCRISKVTLLDKAAGDLSGDETTIIQKLPGGADLLNKLPNVDPNKQKCFSFHQSACRP